MGRLFLCLKVGRIRLCRHPTLGDTTPDNRNAPPSWRSTLAHTAGKTVIATIFVDQKHGRDPTIGLTSRSFGDSLVMF